MKWKPIATAPKTIVEDYDSSQYGDWILVAGARWYDVTTARWWQWKTEPDTNGWLMQCGNNAGSPTHWMPLPKPPTP